MRPWFLWSFAASVALSIFALLRPQDNVPASQGTSSNIAGAEPTTNLQTTTGYPQSIEATQSTLSTPLPRQLHADEWTAANFDPFVGVQPPPPPTPKVQAPIVVVSAPPPPPPPPQPPAMTYRYLGQLVDPDGKQTMYIVRDDAVVPVAIGSKLDEGYIVEGITADGIRLHYPPLNAHTVIYIPPPPDRATP